MKLFSLLLAFVVFAPMHGQSPEAYYSPEDQEIFSQITGQQASQSAATLGERMVSVGTALLNTPYVAKTLEVGTPERLVVNFRGLDCTTFVENVLVLGEILQLGSPDWDTYLSTLERVRYREGSLNGYASRLHYFTDWIWDNVQKGTVEDITAQIGGLPVDKDIDFMGTHPDLYPALSSKGQLGMIREVEASLRGRVFHVLPREMVRSKEDLINDGDIIALATKIEGLDVTHTGIALNRGGRIHLLHASTEGRVLISDRPLSEYLEGINGNTGIIVARPRNPKASDNPE